MKTIYVSKLPKCDFCGKTTDPMFDAPTTVGSWANMCGECYKENASGNADYMGTKMITKEPISKDIKPVDKVLTPKCHTSIESAVFDSVVELECPTCGSIQLMETDCCNYTCHDCGQKLYYDLFEAL